MEPLSRMINLKKIERLTALKRFNDDWTAVKPFISVKQPSVGAANGSSTVLECAVEAFPEAVRYWERPDGRLVDDKRHNATQEVKGKYQVTINVIC